MKKVVCIIGAVCLFTGVTFGAEANFTNAAGGNLWKTAGNWSTGSVPGDYAVISKPGVDCIIDSSTAAVAGNVWIGYSLFGGNGQLAMTGGTLDTGRIQLGIDSVGTFTLSGGDVTCTGVFSVGSYDYVNSGNGTLEMTGGTITTLAMDIPNIGSPATGAVKLYGGTITITGTSGLSFMMQYNSSSTGSMDIRGTGVFKWAGDHIAELDWYKGLGRIYTSEAGKALDISYDGTVTTMQVIPEPTTMVLLGLGGLLFTRKK